MSEDTWLIGCEFSGRVRDAFLKAGYKAMSCDFLPCESDYPGEHYQGDISDLLNEKWKGLIVFPDCTYRTNAGVRWLKNNYYRQNKLKEADLFFNSLFNQNIKYICLENPIPHKYSNVPKYSQIIQPWQFGDNEQKSTCLWLKGLSRLNPEIKIKPENVKQSIHRMPPSKNRGHLRSITYPGIAHAMALQWGKL